MKHFKILSTFLFFLVQSSTVNAGSLPGEFWAGCSSAGSWLELITRDDIEKSSDDVFAILEGKFAGENSTMAIVPISNGIAAIKGAVRADGTIYCAKITGVQINENTIWLEIQKNYGWFLKFEDSKVTGHYQADGVIYKSDGKPLGTVNLDYLAR